MSLLTTVMDCMYVNMFTKYCIWQNIHTCVSTLPHQYFHICTNIVWKGVIKMYTFLMKVDITVHCGNLQE